MAAVTFPPLYAARADAAHVAVTVDDALRAVDRAIANAAPAARPSPGYATVFHSTRVPTEPVEHYAWRFRRHAGATDRDVAAALVVLARFSVHSGHVLCGLTVHRALFAAFLLIAQLGDRELRRSASRLRKFCAIGGIDADELEFLEQAFVDGITGDLCFSTLREATAVPAATRDALIVSLAAQSSGVTLARVNQLFNDACDRDTPSLVEDQWGRLRTPRAASGRREDVFSALAAEAQSLRRSSSMRVASAAGSHRLSQSRLSSYAPRVHQTTVSTPVSCDASPALLELHLDRVPSMAEAAGDSGCREGAAGPPGVTEDACADSQEGNALFSLVPHHTAAAGLAQSASPRTAELMLSEAAIHGVFALERND